MTFLLKFQKFQRTEAKDSFEEIRQGLKADVVSKIFYTEQTIDNILGSQNALFMLFLIFEKYFNILKYVPTL